MNFDLKQFYFLPQGRVNRKQWWLRLILPISVIIMVLAFIDKVTGTYDPNVGVGILSGLFALASLIPAVLVDIDGRLVFEPTSREETMRSSFVVGMLATALMGGSTLMPGGAQASPVGTAVRAGAKLPI